MNVTLKEFQVLSCLAHIIPYDEKPMNKDTCFGASSVTLALLLWKLKKF